DVGADGLLLRWLWTRRFVDHGDIDEVAWQGDAVRGVRLVLEGGASLTIPITRARDDDGLLVMVDERIEEARKEHAARRYEADVSVLHRGDREMAPWIAQLKAIGAGANADHRQAPMDRDRLFRIVEDPAKAPIERAAAAVALTSSIDERDRYRLEDAARATAAPKLRIALETAAKAEDPSEIEAALADLDAEDLAGGPDSTLPVPERRRHSKR